MADMKKLNMNDTVVSDAAEGMRRLREGLRHIATSGKPTDNGHQKKRQSKRKK
jgi:hypothetical protein